MQDLKRKNLTSRSSLSFATKDERVLQFYDRQSCGIVFAEVNNIWGAYFLDSLGLYFVISDSKGKRGNKPQWSRVSHHTTLWWLLRIILPVQCETNWRAVPRDVYLKIFILQEILKPLYLPILFPSHRPSSPTLTTVAPPPSHLPFIKKDPLGYGLRIKWTTVGVVESLMEKTKKLEINTNV